MMKMICGDDEKDLGGIPYKKYRPDKNQNIAWHFGQTEAKTERESNEPNIAIIKPDRSVKNER